MLESTNTAQLAAEILEIEDGQEESQQAVTKDIRWARLVSRLLARLSPVCNKRRFFRLPMHAQATFKLGDTQICADATDISRGGVGLSGDLDQFAQGKPLQLEKIEVGDKTFMMEAGCQTAWVADGRGGVVFCDLSEANKNRSFMSCYVHVYLEYLRQLSSAGQTTAPSRP